MKRAVSRFVHALRPDYHEPTASTTVLCPAVSCSSEHPVACALLLPPPPVEVSRCSADESLPHEAGHSTSVNGQRGDLFVSENESAVPSGNTGSSCYEEDDWHSSLPVLSMSATYETQDTCCVSAHVISTCAKHPVDVRENGCTGFHSATEDINSRNVLCNRQCQCVADDEVSGSGNVVESDGEWSDGDPVDTVEMDEWLRHQLDEDDTGSTLGLKEPDQSAYFNMGATVPVAINGTTLSSLSANSSSRHSSSPDSSAEENSDLQEQSRDVVPDATSTAAIIDNSTSCASRHALPEIIQHQCTESSNTSLSSSRVAGQQETTEIIDLNLHLDSCGVNDSENVACSDLILQNFTPEMAVDRSILQLPQILADEKSISEAGTHAINVDICDESHRTMTKIDQMSPCGHTFPAETLQDSSERQFGRDDRLSITGRLDDARAINTVTSYVSKRSCEKNGDTACVQRLNLSNSDKCSSNSSALSVCGGHTVGSEAGADQGNDRCLVAEEQATKNSKFSGTMRRLDQHESVPSDRCIEACMMNESRTLHHQRTRSRPSGHRHSTIGLFSDRQVAPPDIIKRSSADVDNSEDCASDVVSSSCDYADPSDARLTSRSPAKYETDEVSERLDEQCENGDRLAKDTQSLRFQLELLKDRLQDEQEQHRSLQRQTHTMSSEQLQLRKACSQLEQQLETCSKQLAERHSLLQKHGLVMIGGDTGEMARGEAATLISNTSAQLLATSGHGSLECRIRRLASERNTMEQQVALLRQQLQQQLSAHAQRTSTVADAADLQRELDKLKTEYKEKLQKYEQERANLQASVQRLNRQVHRTRLEAQYAECKEDELNAERRKLTRQLRESESVIEELEANNRQLNKRMEKLNNAKTTLLKGLAPSTRQSPDS